MGYGDNGQFTTHVLCHSFLLWVGLLTPAPAWDPSRGRQSITNFSNMDLLPMGCSYSRTAPSRVSHRATGPARSLLQHGFPMGLQSPLGAHLLSAGSVKCKGSFCQFLTEATPAAPLYHNHARQTPWQKSWSSRRDLFRNSMNFLI